MFLKKPLMIGFCIPKQGVLEFGETTDGCVRFKTNSYVRVTKSLSRSGGIWLGETAVQVFFATGT